MHFPIQRNLLAIIYLSLCCFTTSKYLVSGNQTNHTQTGIQTNDTQIDYIKIDYNMYIRNALPDNVNLLTLHCFSGDDDLGWHTLGQNEEFHWYFVLNYLMTTKFYCSFWWTDKTRGFAVFDFKIAMNLCGPMQRRHNDCFWQVQADGFYVANVHNPDPGLLHKKNWWIDR